MGRRAAADGGVLTAVAKGGRAGAATEAERAQAVADARFWRADALVLRGQPAAAGAAAVLDALYGPGRQVDDVWVGTCARSATERRA